MASPLLIHSHVGDAYFTDTIYEHPETAHRKSITGGRSDSHGGTYIEHVRALSASWPRLSYLADFMEASTVPAKAKLLPPHDKLVRQNRCKVSVICFGDGQDTVRKDCDSLLNLTRLLRQSDDKTKAGRLIVCEDISAGLIELLGTHFDVDPRFFRGHLEDHTWYNTKDPWIELPDLESAVKRRPYVNIRYVQARYFENDLHIEGAKAKAASFNVLRRIDLEGSAISGTEKWWDGKGGSVGLIRHKASLWVRPAKDHDVWLGILLLDPTLTEGHPLWNGYGRVDAPPGMGERHQSRLSPSTSLFEAFISQTMASRSIRAASEEIGPEIITAPLYPLIFGQWLVTLEYTFTGLFQVEWFIDASRLSEHQDKSRQRTPQDLDDCLQRLHKWQRRIPFFIAWLHSATISLEGLYSRSPEHSMASSTSTHTPNLPWRDIVSDFRSMHDRFSALALRADKILNIATSISSVQESKRTIEQSQSISRVTYLAFVFIPLSFVSSFLSMNGDFENQRPAYAKFFEIALPLGLVAIVVAMYSGRIGNLWCRIFGMTWKC